jgi:hypothetical protein
MKKSVETQATKPVEVKPYSKDAQLHRKPGKKGAKSIVTPTPTPGVAQPVNVVTPEPIVEVKPPVEQPAPLTLESLQKAIQLLRVDFDTHTVKLEEILVLVSRKRKPGVNGNTRVSILDTVSNITYPSKNGTFRALLKEGKLDDLVAKGIFGPDPKRNSFAWYSLNRAYPNRFIEIHPEQVKNG